MQVVQNAAGTAHGMMGMLFAPRQNGMGARTSDFFDASSLATINLDTSKIHDTFYEQSAPCADACYMALCCGCNPTIHYKAAGQNDIKYSNSCLCCSAWKTHLNGEYAGKVKKAGCCDNGCCFCLCPWLKCGGMIKYLSVYNRSDDSLYTLRQKLFPCWPCCMYIGSCCAPIGVLCGSMEACCQYMNGTEYRMIKQPIFGPMSGNPMDDSAVGSITQVHRAFPVCCLCAGLQPIRFAMELPAHMDNPGDVAATGLVALLYQGLTIPCRPKACCGPGFQVPSGVDCLDMGLMTEKNYSNFAGMLNRES